MLSELQSIRPPTLPSTDSPSVQATIRALKLVPNPEGGFFVETDRDPNLLPAPGPPTGTTVVPGPGRPCYNPAVRNASTTIYYYLTPSSPRGHFHRNRSRIVHTLHRGRGRYVLIHPPAPARGGGTLPPRVETFVVGSAVERGERLQWVVEGSVWKASFLLPDREGEDESEGGLLISETTVPGFEYCDHDFMKSEELTSLVGEETAKLAESLVWKGGNKDA